MLADERIGRADLIVCGGDLLAGPMPAECLDLLMALGPRVRFIVGNADREVLAGGDETSRWCMRHLGVARASFARDWMLSLRVDVPRLGELVFCHATPRSDEEIMTRVTRGDLVLEMLASTSADIVVCGHIHVRYDRRVTPARRVVNTGSVGMPYEGRAGVACWGWVDRVIEFMTTTYDADSALRAIEATGFPRATEVFEPAVRGQASPFETTEYFEALRLDAA